MIRPTLRAVLLFAAGIPVAVLVIVLNADLWPLVLAYIALAILALGLDALMAMPGRALMLRADVPPMLYAGDSDLLRVNLFNSSTRWAVRLEGRCDVDPLLRPPGHRFAMLGPGQEAAIEFPLTPLRRGTATVERLWLRWRGPLGLAQRQRLEPEPLRLPVVPNVRAVRTAAARFYSPDALIGMKSQKQQGEGSEFDALREYLPGLDHRSIDWKQSARHRKLLCKEFRTERNHPIVLAFDTGYLMREPVNGVAKLDHAINAGLLLSFMSVKAGDQVGLFGFDSRVRLYLPPSGGNAGYNRVQRRSADLDYSHEETNFTLALTDLMGRLNRRALIVLMSDFVDTITAELMLENVTRLAQRHLVIFVTLQDPHLQTIAARRPDRLLDMTESVVADNFLRDRAVVFERLRRLGVHCLDVAPEQIGMDLLNRYLLIKQRELI
jgi:uncharacterized protein (DUF58 family)